MASPLWLESDGGGDRRLSLVAHGYRQPAKSHAARVGGRRGRYPGGRHDVFSEDGIQDRRRGVTRATQFFAPPTKERLLVHGDCAVEVGRIVVEGEYSGRESSGEYRYTSVDQNTGALADASQIRSRSSPNEGSLVETVAEIRVGSPLQSFAASLGILRL